MTHKNSNQIAFTLICQLSSLSEKFKSYRRYFIVFLLSKNPNVFKLTSINFFLPEFPNYNSIEWTCTYTSTTKGTFIHIDLGNFIFNYNCIVSASFQTKFTSYTFITNYFNHIYNFLNVKFK